LKLVLTGLDLGEQFLDPLIFKTELKLFFQRLPPAAVYCHYQQECHILGVRPNSPIISMHGMGCIDHHHGHGHGHGHSDVVSKNNDISSDQSAVIFMSKSKMKRRRLWRRQTSSLTEKRDIETITSSSFNLVRCHPLMTSHNFDPLKSMRLKVDNIFDF
jgi:hypothetical protein